VDASGSGTGPDAAGMARWALEQLPAAAAAFVLRSCLWYSCLLSSVIPGLHPARPEAQASGQQQHVQRQQQ
jgi:hypothetical protein